MSRIVTSLKLKFMSQAAEQTRPQGVKLRDQVAACVTEWSQDAKRQAMAGDVQSMILFARMAADGYGMKPNLPLAYKWLHEAQQCGSRLARMVEQQLRSGEEVDY